MGAEESRDALFALAALAAEAEFAVDDEEWDRLRELRGSLPREVMVVAPEHPLAGWSLVVEGRRRVGGVECLLVRLPDGSAGSVALGATSAGEGGSGTRGAVLSVDGVRRLRALLERRLGDGSGT